MVMGGNGFSARLGSLSCADNGREMEAGRLVATSGPADPVCNFLRPRLNSIALMDDQLRRLLGLSAMLGTALLYFRSTHLTANQPLPLKGDVMAESDM